MGVGVTCPSPDRAAVARLRMRQKGLLRVHEHGAGSGSRGSPRSGQPRGLPHLVSRQGLASAKVFGKVGSAQDAQDARAARRGPPRARRVGAAGLGFRFSGPRAAGGVGGAQELAGRQLLRCRGRLRPRHVRATPGAPRGVGRGGRRAAVLAGPSERLHQLLVLRRCLLVK